MIFAHSLDDRPQSEWEPLSHHLQAVGARAAEFAAPFGLAEAARVAGQLHDIGKCSAAFQAYIASPRDDGASAKRGPDHSTAGAREAVVAYKGSIGRLLGYAIAGHHAGLADWPEIERRLNDDYPLETYVGWQAQTGVPPAVGILRPTTRFGDSAHKGFGASFLTRMLFSCLVDADFLETEKLYAGAKGEEVVRGGHTSLSELRERLRRHMVSLGGSAKASAVNALRAQVLEYAVSQAARSPGLFTLTVPTGGGKTLASLSFALEHAEHHAMRRVF